MQCKRTPACEVTRKYNTPPRCRAPPYSAGRLPTGICKSLIYVSLVKPHVTCGLRPSCWMIQSAEGCISLLLIFNRCSNRALSNRKHFHHSSLASVEVKRAGHDWLRFETLGNKVLALDGPVATSDRDQVPHALAVIIDLAQRLH